MLPPITLLELHWQLIQQECRACHIWSCVRPTLRNYVKILHDPDTLWLIFVPSCNCVVTCCPVGRSCTAGQKWWSKLCYQNLDRSLTSLWWVWQYYINDCGCWRLWYLVEIAALHCGDVPTRWKVWKSKSATNNNRQISWHTKYHCKLTWYITCLCYALRPVEV